MQRSYPGLAQAPRIELSRGDAGEMAAAAQALIAPALTLTSIMCPRPPARAGCTPMQWRNTKALAESRSFSVRPIPALRPLGWLARLARPDALPEPRAAARLAWSSSSAAC
jgi:hypothetical protein